jgi:hypothetical protein
MKQKEIKLKDPELFPFTEAPVVTSGLSEMIESLENEE